MGAALMGQEIDSSRKSSRNLPMKNTWRYDDFHLAAWRKGQMMLRIRLDGLPWHQGKAHAPGQRRQQELSLHQRKVIADADAWPGSKGKIGVAWQLLFSCGREA